MAITASVCSLCGLISLTRKHLPKVANCIKCNRPLEIFTRDNVNDLWTLVSSRPPTAYRSSSASHLKARFAAAYERFSARTIISAADSKVPSEWRAAAYTARKQLREAGLSRRRRPKLREL
jgi:hypothetical protein